MRSYLLLLFMVLFASVSRATDRKQGELSSVPDSVSLATSQLDEDYVRASLVIASPGDFLFTTFGHACLRLECPTHQLDYVYSYESESMGGKYLEFLSGDLHMAIKAVPTEEYVQQYKAQGRGVASYSIHLPIAVKQRLWRQMDERCEEARIPYDYYNRNCAVSVFRWLRESIDADSLVVSEWPASCMLTNKEKGVDYIENKWLRFLFLTLQAGEAEYATVSMEDRVKLPSELLYILQHATAYGNTLVKVDKEVLAEQTKVITPCPVTPLMVIAVILLLFLSNGYFGWAWLHYPLWIFQVALGMLLTYLLVFSTLPCTQWNWLIIPFCPLTAVFWYWRQYWLLPYALVCVVWIVWMLLLPHRVVLPEHYFMVLTLAISAVEMKISSKNSK